MTEDLTPVQPEVARACDEVYRQLLVLADLNVTIKEVFAAAVPSPFKPLHECPECHVQWTARTSRKIMGTKLYRQWMRCDCTKTQTRVVSEEFIHKRPRRKKQL